uniref:photosystem II protein Z n=1 Tax=Trentepohlia sp. BN17 TaxID=3063876 RepID=UPI001EDE3242|nr:photosystem II protein Z [Trentepohlia sp. BN17]UIB38748.1 photosystem II protein Z [Trentepohlia sp. BN17]
MAFFQLLLLAFIAISFGLAVLIPVAFGNPDTWAKNKRLVFLGVSVWFSFVFVLGISNSFVS